MKKLITKLGVTLALSALGLMSLNAQTASLQVIHNCTDPAASTVDIYVNGTLTLDNFAFRSATSFLTVPSGVAITVGVAPGNSTSVADTLKSFVLGPLASGGKYIAIASGVVTPGNFASNPNSRSTAFTINVITNAETMAGNMNKVDFAVYHGCTDAPGVDVNISNGGATLVSDAKYGDATAYLSVDPTWYPIDVAPHGVTTPVASYVADLSGLAGGAAVVFASGFLTPSTNQNGPAFGLFAALASGTVVQLPIQQFAKVQVLHNCADPAADSVDVYLDGTKLLDNFKFRTGTPFVSVLAGVNHTIAVAPASSASVADAIASFPNINLTANQNYIVAASGVVGTGFAANPNSVSTAFTLKVIPNAETMATDMNKVDFAVLHGCTDAPAVDVNITGGSTLVPNAKYLDATGYLSVNPTWYPIDIAPAGNSTAVASYVADLTGLSGGAALVFASGFLTPSANNNGPAFGLYALLANGTVIALPVQQQAKVQVLHNCADPLASTVDVYIDGTLALDNFAFRTATPFIDLLAGVSHVVAIAPANSTSAADAIWTHNYTLTANQNYVLTASGVVGTGFATNPDSRSTAFDVLVKTPAETAATDNTKFDFFVIHGATDAPTVKVVVDGGPTLVPAAAFGDQTDYIPVAGANYIIDVQNAAGTANVAQYVANTTSLVGTSGVILASGFLNPAANNNGPAFGLFVAPAAGGSFIPLSVYTGVNELDKEIGLNMYPNPSNGQLNFNFELPQAQKISIDLVDMNGKVVQNVIDGTYSGTQKVTTNVNELSNGLYLARVTTAGKTSVTKFSVMQ